MLEVRQLNRPKSYFDGHLIPYSMHKNLVIEVENWTDPSLALMIIYKHLVYIKWSNKWNKEINGSKFYLGSHLITQFMQEEPVQAILYNQQQSSQKISLRDHNICIDVH